MREQTSRIAGHDFSKHECACAEIADAQHARRGTETWEFRNVWFFIHALREVMVVAERTDTAYPIGLGYLALYVSHREASAFKSDPDVLRPGPLHALKQAMVAYLCCGDSANAEADARCEFGVSAQPADVLSEVGQGGQLGKGPAHGPSNDAPKGNFARHNMFMIPACILGVAESPLSFLPLCRGRGCFSKLFTDSVEQQLRSLDAPHPRRHLRRTALRRT
eukprot:9483171-Pyramimonas_sp.AAC.1